MWANGVVEAIGLNRGERPEGERDRALAARQGEADAGEVEQRYEDQHRADIARADGGKRLAAALVGEHRAHRGRGEGERSADRERDPDQPAPTDRIGEETGQNRRLVAGPRRPFS